MSPATIEVLVLVEFFGQYYASATGSKQSLRRFCGGKACLGFSLPQTPLMWEPPALGLPFFFIDGACDAYDILAH